MKRTWTPWAVAYFGATRFRCESYGPSSEDVRYSPIFGTLAEAREWCARKNGTNS